MTKENFGKVFGDKGYINKALANLLYDDGIQLITAVRRNMKQKAYFVATSPARDVV